MANEKLRRYAKARGVPFWKIAQALSISEPTMTRWFRTEMTEEKTAKIKAIIDEIGEKVEWDG